MFSRPPRAAAPAKKKPKASPGKRAHKRPASKRPAQKGKSAATTKGGSGRLRRWFPWLVKAVAVLVVWAGIALAGLFVWYGLDLPEVDQYAGLTRAPNITLLARDGSEISSFGGRFGEKVDLASLPPALPRAILAIEDRRFYDHFGVDPRGLARAMWANVKARRFVQGGSTITQQLAKNLFLTPERSIKRKVQEMMLALRLERRFSKDEILTIYMNRVYLGGGTYGVDAAARLYFDKPARAVNLYEAALLAGLLKAPSRLNPLRDADAADDRTRLVLVAMEEAGYISTKQRRRALEYSRPPAQGFRGRAPYFADWIMAQLRDYLGAVAEDLRVITTLDPVLQSQARRSLKETLDREGPNRSVEQAALVSIDPKGAVRAMVGGRDYGASQFNRVTQALRQPGSAFKIFVFLAAFERLGLNVEDKVRDAPVKLGDWEPRNYADKYYGDVTLREAFARSLNSVAVRLLQETGPDAVAQMASRMGISSNLTRDGGLALGASEVTLLELTGAYGAIAAQGRVLWPYGIEEIRNAEGKLLYRRGREEAETSMASSAAVAALRDAMAATVSWGTGKAASSIQGAAGKTGTSQDFRDAWFLGYSGGLTTGVWFGNDDNKPMNKVTGGGLPAQLWASVMAKARPVRVPAPPVGAVIAAAPESVGEEEELSFIDRILKTLGSGVEQEPSRAEQRFQRYFRQDK